MDGSRPTPALTEILANLAQFGNAAQSVSAAVGVDNADSFANGRSTGTELAQRTAQAEDRRLRPQARSNASPKPMIDPASITTWQEGLRCVTKIAAQNAQFATSIRMVK